MQGETKADWMNKWGNNRGARGFSLIELMAVVLIMGILGTVVAVVVGPKIFTARAGATKTSLQTIQREIDGYHMNKTTYPDNLAIITTITNDKDGWDQPFYYLKTIDGTRPYALSSAGPDKMHGTKDDISVWDLNSPSN